MNLEALLSQFYSEAKILGNQTEATIKWYERSIGLFLRHIPHVQKLHDFNAKNIRLYLYYNGRLEKNWTVKTFYNYYGAFRGFLNWCIRRKYLKENPILEVEKPKKEKTLYRI